MNEESAANEMNVRVDTIVKPTLLFGDCLELMTAITDGSVDMVLADPPYGTTASKWDSVVDFSRLWCEYKRVLKPDGVVALFAAQPFTTDLINSNREWFKYCWYWHKNQGTNFFHARRMPIRKIEEIVIFAKSNKSYEPQISSGHVPTRSARGQSKGRAYYGTNRRDSDGGKTDRYPDNILRFKCVNNYARLHQSQKPTELLEFLIRTYTREGGVVLDTFAGSGSTLIAGSAIGRYCIGMESDSDIYAVAKTRLTA